MPKKSTPEYWRKRQELGLDKIQKGISQPVIFIGVDGEGIEEEGKQNYALLSSSLHNPIYNRSGLKTEQCLQYLLSLPSNPRHRLVGYAFSYDANMILLDLNEEQRRELYEKESVWFKGRKADYRISRRKGKTLSITEYEKRPYFHSPVVKLRSVTVWDVFGFFQGRFVKAVKEYKLNLTPEEWEILESGKAARGEFIWEDLDQITAYNHLECDLLVKLMNEVQSLLRGMDLHLKRWDGAGAIAAALMLKHNVKKHVYRGFPTEVEDAIMRSYFGGRSQCVQFGVFDETVYHYDINSSYPSSYRDLPSLHGEWKLVDRFIPEEKYALYQIEWNIPEKEPVLPFPYRDTIGTIRYPNQGRGIYHAILLQEAMPRFKKWIKIERGWIFKPHTDELPFAWIDSFMDERLRLKAEGDLRHITMKLGANSIYGKTAQGVSYGTQLPPYQSYYWAGMITAWTHAQLLKAGLQAPSDIVFFGTDAVFSKSKLDLPIGKTLGTWEDCGPIHRFELFQPGLYRMHFNGENPQSKTRGFHSDEVDFDKLVDLWNEKRFGGIYETTVTRFQGLEVCSAQNRMDDWGTWKEFPRNITLKPGGFGFVIVPGKKYFHDGDYSGMNFRFRYIDGGKPLSARFEKKNLIIPDPDDTVGLSLYLQECEYYDNPTID
jgi:hypothetical protein